MSNSLGMKSDISTWLDQTGYPLELRARETLRRVGFWTIQGSTVPNQEKTCEREIDLLATYTAEWPDPRLVRVTTVLECKHSTEPLIVFMDDPNTSLAFCMCNLISSEAAYAVLWCKAGGKQLGRLPCVSPGTMVGVSAKFKGEKEKCDRFFKAASSVVNKAVSYVNSYDETIPRQVRSAPICSVVALPTIIVDSPIIEANLVNNDIQLTEVEDTVLSFRQNSTGPHCVLVSIVKDTALPRFARHRLCESKSLARFLCKYHQQLEQSFEEPVSVRIGINRCSRGVIGIPKIIAELCNSNDV